MGGPAGRFSGLVVALLIALASPATAELRLAPGQPFDRALADRLLGPRLATQAGADRVRLHVENPVLPLGNPYPRIATLAVADAVLTADDGFVAVVEIAVGEREPLPLVLRGKLARLVGVPVPTAPIAAGARLAPDAFETLWLPAARVRGQWVRTADELAGLEAYRALLAGQPIATDAVGARRLVRRGERVTLVFEEGGLRVEAIGTARGDGGIGDVVEVENDRSGTIVNGRVTSPGRLHVETR